MTPITLPRFICRCYKIGDIMTEARSKTAPFGLSQTCISYLEEWVTDYLYGSKREFSTKYTQKGLTVENAAIEFASDVLGWGWVPKNTERRTDHYLTGEADVVLANTIADVKSSWDQYTFPLLDEEIPTKGYDWQLQGYMHLWDKSIALLVYCLMDAPEELVQREARRLAWDRYEEEVTESIYQEAKYKMTFSHLPDYLRIKTYPVHRDQERINAIMARVEQCNVYIQHVIVPRLEEQIRLVSGRVAA